MAISISLVPPLSVVGLALSNKAGHDAAGAMLLFATNFACIMVMGVIVMLFYRVPWMVPSSRRKQHAQLIAVFSLVALLALVAVPLYFTSKQLSDIYAIEDCLESEINEWGNPKGWYVSYVVTSRELGQYVAKVTIAGAPPFPNATDFPNATGFCGADSLDMSFVPVKNFDLY